MPPHPMNCPTPTLLLVEDNEDDVFIFQRACKRAAITDAVQIVNDGQEAMDYLAGIGAFEDRTRFPLPYLVMLDLKLPRRSGIEVLEWMNRHDDLAQLPVIVLTSSAELRDIQRTRELGALHYLVKPPAVEVLAELVETHRSGFGPVAATDGARPMGDKFAEHLVS
jgi:CheY-like chemotaxis protein